MLFTTLAKPYQIAAHALCQGAIMAYQAVTSKTAQDLYKTLWIIAQVAFWMTVLAVLYTRQVVRSLRAYYQAEWADTVQLIITYPDRCLDTSPALLDTADSSSEPPALSLDSLPSQVRLILDSDRKPTAMLRAIASFYDITWRNARGPGKHLLNQQIKQALNAYPHVYQALNSQ
ncbi:MAG: hypothetical protein F6K00_33515 [Leptolyngbya sp. SIOISBB]|nr:hypothetical protein [Leptolyngbya sp. SIOISBB]